jgi:MFS-type transporter involved in bile tolerance (Atg22 family)
MVALFTTTFDSQRAGFASPILLLLAGLIVLRWVREERAHEIPLQAPA